MAKRVLLISTNQCSTPDPVFPLGLSHLNAALRRVGHQTRWIDFHQNSESVAETVAEFQPDIVGVSLRNIDDVLIRRRETYFRGLNALCASVHAAKSCPVVLGGSGFSIFPERLLALSGADFGIRGEGEASFVSLISALEAQRDVRSIPGLVYRGDHMILANGQQPSVSEISLEPADRPEALATHYLNAGGMLNLQTQRGCAHSCCYCTYPVIEGRMNRRRPPEAVADELEQIQARGAQYAFIVDSVFNSSPRHVTEICEAILRRRLTLRWGCFLRPQGLTPELMQLMSRAGLAHIEFGSDSFCDTILDEYDKRLTFDDILRSSELAAKAGIDYCHFLICGGPGETANTLQTGFQNSRHLTGAVIMAVVGMRIYPGTALCVRAFREGRIAPDTDLLEPVYYIAAGLTVDSVFEQLHDFARRAPNWIVGDPSPTYARFVERLRSRGVAGPLWSYLSLIQRLWPAAPAPASA